MPASKKRFRSTRADPDIPTLTIHSADGPYDSINGKWVKVDKVVTENFIFMRVPTRPLRSKRRVGATR